MSYLTVSGITLGDCPNNDHNLDSDFADGSESESETEDYCPMCNELAFVGGHCCACEYDSMEDKRMCPDCRGKGQYAGLDITCRRCNGSGVWRPAPEPATTQRPVSAADDPDHLRPDKGGNRASDDYW